MIVYEGIGPEKDTVVGEDVAFAYAMERMRNADEAEKEGSWNGIFPETG